MVGQKVLPLSPMVAYFDTIVDGDCCHGRVGKVGLATLEVRPLGGEALHLTQNWTRKLFFVGAA